MLDHRNARRFGGSTASVLTSIALIGALAACSSPANPAAAGTAPASTPSAAASDAPSPHPTEVSPPGDVPDNQAYVAFTASDGNFSVKVPEGWAQSTSGAVTTFTDKLNSVSTEQSASAAPPTVDSVKQNIIPKLTAAEPQFALTDVKTFTRSGGDGVVVTYMKDSPPNAVTGSVVRDAVELFLFWKGGTQVAVTLTSPDGADNVDPWNVVTRSFAWLK